MKPEKQLSDVFINYISLFKLSYVLTVFNTFYYFQLINTIPPPFDHLSVNWALPPPAAG